MPRARDTSLFLFSDMQAMATIGSGAPVEPKTNVAELLRNLNSTAEEGDIAAFSDDEDAGEDSVVEWGASW